MVNQKQKQNKTNKQKQISRLQATLASDGSKDRQV